jgi:GntR family transcriptional regulator
MPSAMPDYIRIAGALEGGIGSGRREPGTKLPAIAALCDQFNVSDNTVRSALVTLEAGGLLFGHQGKGQFVTEAKEWCGPTS